MITDADTIKNLEIVIFYDSYFSFEAGYAAEMLNTQHKWPNESFKVILIK